MDLYSENFKIQEMIDSDMRCELDDYLSVLPRSPGGSPSLSSFGHVLPMDIIGDTAKDSDMSEDEMGGWMNSSQIYNMSSDLDSIGGLLVNPLTGLPVSAAHLTPTSSIITSTSLTGAVNLTLTPQSNINGESSASTSAMTVPVHVITTTTTLVTDGDTKPSQVNLTVAVPTSKTPPPLKASKGTQVQHLLSIRKNIQEAAEENESPKSRSKQGKNSKLPKSVSIENSYPKPAYSYSCLIAMALKNSKTGSLPVNEIYDFMTENFPYFKTAPNGWKNSVRHNLSLNKCFEKIEKPSGNGAQRKGYLWALNPNKVEKMEEELQKWGNRDPEAIRKSMANPEKLELIEKGELNNVISETKLKQNTSVYSNHHVKKEVFPPHEKLHEKRIKEEPTNSINPDFSPLDAPVGMDPALPEFDLQKGIWENLCDDRLQFIQSPMNSSSPKPGSISSNLILDEDSLPETSPSNLPKSFIHANYAYTCSRQSSSSELSSDEPSPQRRATCDA